MYYNTDKMYSVRVPGSVLIINNIHIKDDTNQIERLEMKLEDKVATAIAVPSKLKPAQIIGLIPKGQAETDTRLILNKGNLKQISSKVKTGQVALLSIAGPFREGKSLLLSCMISYLRHLSQGKRSSDWMGESEREASLQEGFLWQNGVERETTGVNMCPEPFTLTSNDGSKFDVLLMDTPGTFDDYTEEKDWATIPILSLLTSSALIFNISKHLQKDSLKSLKGFMDFGRMATGTDLNDDDDDDDGKPFENVTVFSLEFHEFLCLKYEQSKEYAQIREQIRHDFEKLNCILHLDAIENFMDINYNESVAWMTHNFASNVKNMVKTFKKYWSESEKGAMNMFDNIFLFNLSSIEGEPERITRYTKIIEDIAAKKDAALKLEHRLQIILVFNNSVQAYETKLKKISKLSKTEAEFMKQAWMAITEIFEGFKVESELSPSKCSELKIELEKKREEELENLVIRLQKEEAELKNRVRGILKNSVEAYETKLMKVSKLSKSVAEFHQKSLGTMTEILKEQKDESVLSTRECSELKMKLEEKRKEELENLRTRFQKEEAELKSSVGGILKKSADAYYTKMKEIAKLSESEVEFNEKALAAIQVILEDFKVQSELSTRKPFQQLKTKREMKRKQDSENVLTNSHIEEPEPKRCFSMA